MFRLKYYVLIPKVLIPKINTQVWLSHMKKTVNHNRYTNGKKEYGTEDRYSSEPQKAHLTCELDFIGVAQGGAKGAEAPPPLLL